MTTTSVKVALRIRPLSEKEIQQNCDECLSPIPDTTQVLIGTNHSFTFDYVFPSETEQEDVFLECAKPLIDKLIEGYNVTILAYGQTGSGKTYSMGTTLGSGMKPENIGIVPRAINHLFSDLAERKAKNPEYEFEVLVSFLELYNEDLIDLLNPQSREGDKKEKCKLTIREDADGQIYWAGVKEVPVSSPEDLLNQLTKGSLVRTVASTDMNAVSSRSHAIFSVILRQTKIESFEEENKENDLQAADFSKKSKKSKVSTKIASKFHFVDLAGSERLKRTNASADRAKEGIAINGGLLALGNVISALGDESRKTTHIPYRDSKLTRLLQDSLGGNSQTLMLACVSPADSNFMETLNTLKYANRARNIKNKVSVNENYGINSIEINQLRGQISRLMLENQTLRSNGEEATRGYEEEIMYLKNELGVTKMKLQDAEQQVITANVEKNTLLMDINRQDLSESDSDHHMKTHQIIQNYEQQILNYKNQVTELQNQVQTLVVSRKSSFSSYAPDKERGHTRFYDELGNNSEDEECNNESDGENKKNRKNRSKRLKARTNGHLSISEESANLEVQLPIELPPSRQLGDNVHHYHQMTSRPSKRRDSNSSRCSDLSVSSCESNASVSQQQNAFALTRMLHQIQSDIAVKEQLIIQLKQAEYKMAQMQENLIASKHERDAAVKRAASARSGISTRDKQSILLELKVRYEHKMKRLIQEIGDLRRKYNEATRMNTTTKNKSEITIKNLKSQIDQLKADKVCISKRLKEKTVHFNEMTERNKHEIQALRRKEKVFQEHRKRFESANKSQKVLLEKRRLEAIESAKKLKSATALLKKTKAIIRAFRGKRRVNHDFSNIYDEIFGSD